MIRSATIRNFKNIKDLRIELDRLTVFVGANGSGKTSVLDAINRAAQVQPHDPNWGAAQREQLDWIYLRGGSGDISVFCETDGGPFGFAVIPPEPLPRTTIPPKARPWQFRFWDENQSIEQFEEARNAATPLVFLRLDARRLAKESYSETTRPTIESDGSGAASVLAFMALNDPDSFEELLNHVRKLLPQIRRIRFRKVPIVRSKYHPISKNPDSGLRSVRQVFQGEALLLDYIHAKDIAAHTASEGTLIIIGLMTVLLGPDRPKFCSWMTSITGFTRWPRSNSSRMIGQILESFPDLQILATAHSPYLLNYLAPEQVRIMATDSEGHACCGRLSDHPTVRHLERRDGPGRDVEPVRREVACGRGGRKVSLEVAVVYEASADLRTATELADRVLVDAIEWLETEHLDHQRTWSGDHLGNSLAWKGTKQLAASHNIRAVGSFNGNPADPDAQVDRWAIRLLRFLFPKRDGVMLIRDRDDQPERRAGFEQARNQEEIVTPVVINLAVVERESWVICGFDPIDDSEESRLAGERQKLGFDPRLRSHELTACKDDQANRSPKRVLHSLGGGDQERERHCWQRTSLEILNERGSENGLTLFLEEVRELIAPLIGHVAKN